MMSRAGRLGAADDWGLIRMGSKPSYRRDTTTSGRQSTQTVKNTIQMTVSCRNLLKVLQDNENLTWADETELAPGNCLEGGRVFPKPMGLVARAAFSCLRRSRLSEARRSSLRAWIVLARPWSPNSPSNSRTQLRKTRAQPIQRPCRRRGVTTGASTQSSSTGVAGIAATRTYQTVSKSTSENLHKIASR